MGKLHLLLQRSLWSTDAHTRTVNDMQRHRLIIMLVIDHKPTNRFIYTLYFDITVKTMITKNTQSLHCIFLYKNKLMNELKYTINTNKS